MKFKVLEFNTTEDNMKYTRKLEQRWLDMRPDIASNPKYYNKTCRAGGGFDQIIQINRVKNRTHHFLGGQIQRKINFKRVQNNTHNFQSQKHKQLVREIAKEKVKQGTHPFCKSDFNKIPFILKCSDGRSWEFESKQHAIQSGITAGMIDKVKKYKQFLVTRGSYKSNLIYFKRGDILTYHELEKV
jgi:hypothetical protein